MRWRRRGPKPGNGLPCQGFVTFAGEQASVVTSIGADTVLNRLEL